MITVNKGEDTKPKPPAKAKTTLSKGKGKVVEQELVSDKLVPVPKDHVTGPAKVGFSIGVTKNLGNFESLRIDVHIEVPCGTDLEDMEHAHEFIKGWAIAKLEEAVEHAMT